MKFICWLLVPIAILAVDNPPHRPSQAPFVSGDTFRSFCDYAYDELDTSLNPAVIPSGATVFVKADDPFLEDFFIKIHPHILNKYILVTHNTDADTPGRFHSFLDDEKIIAWFAQNYDGFEHPKMHPIPIGIANYTWACGHTEIISEVQRAHLPKRHIAHMSFRAWTYPKERDLAILLFSNTAYCYYYPPLKHFHEYLYDCSASYFSISPRGNGLDTHRLWECLYIGTIPIVKSSSLDRLYQDLPILIIQNWEDVNEDFLMEKYKEFKNKTFNMEKININYWINLINSYKGLK